MPSYKKPKLNRRALPQVVNPAQVRCIPVQIPDDPEWLALFVGAVDALGKRSAWDYDPATVDDLRTVSDRWRGITDDIQQKILAQTPCEATTPSDPQDCTIINPIHPSIGYFPNHPTITPGTGAPVWPVHGWCTNCHIPGLGLATDALVNVAAGPFFTDLNDLLNSGVPSFTLHFSGEGQVDLRFASVPAGGTVWVFPDGNPLVGQAVDLEWVDLDDFAGTAAIEILIGILQGELVNQTVVTHEVTFDTAGSHTLTGWFFPKVQAVEWPPIGWGGGLRSVQLCGDSIVLEDAPMDVDIQCSAGQLELLIDSVVKTTIDLDVCHPHPAPPVVPDYTLARNNGDLQLLQDAVEHSTVPFPNYSVDRVDDTFRLFRDSLVHDTADYPDYLLIKPDPQTIRLTRDGLPVSDVVDEDTIVQGADMITYFEATWDFTLPRTGGIQPPSMTLLGNLGIWIHEQGFATTFDEPSGRQDLDLFITLHDFIPISRIRATYLVSNGADGDWTHFAVQPGGLTHEFDGGAGTANGPETRELDMSVDWMWNTTQTVRFQYVDLVATALEIVTLQKIEFMGIGYPNFKFFADANQVAQFNHLQEAFST